MNFTAAGSVACTGRHSALVDHQARKRPGAEVRRVGATITAILANGGYPNCTEGHLHACSRSRSFELPLDAFCVLMASLSPVQL